MNQNLHVNKTNFHMKDFALGLALKQRRNATRKSPIFLQVIDSFYCFSVSSGLFSDIKSRGRWTVVSGPRVSGKLHGIPNCVCNSLCQG